MCVYPRDAANLRSSCVCSSSRHGCMLLLTSTPSHLSVPPCVAMFNLLLTCTRLHERVSPWHYGFPVRSRVHHFRAHMNLFINAYTLLLQCVPLYCHVHPSTHICTLLPTWALFINVLTLLEHAHPCTYVCSSTCSCTTLRLPFLFLLVGAAFKWLLHPLTHRCTPFFSYSRGLFSTIRGASCTIMGALLVACARLLLWCLCHVCLRRYSGAHAWDCVLTLGLMCMWGGWLGGGGCGASGCELELGHANWSVGTIRVAESVCKMTKTPTPDSDSFNMHIYTYNIY